MSRKHNLTDEDVDRLREVQADGFQALLFSMRELGESSAFIQLEIDGVLHYVAARELNQTEFDDLVREVVARR